MPAVELPIARTGEFAAVIEGPVDRQHTACREQATHPGKKSLHGIPAQDVERVGRENSIAADSRPVAKDIELQRLRQIQQGMRRAPGADGAEFTGVFARLPAEPGHGARKMHRMLAGATADLEHLTRCREAVLQNSEDHILVAFAGLGAGQLVHGGAQRTKIHSSAEESSGR